VRVWNEIGNDHALRCVISVLPWLLNYEAKKFHAKAQRRTKKGAKKTLRNAVALCAFVPLLLCVFARNPIGVTDAPTAKEASCC